MFSHMRIIAKVKLAAFSCIDTLYSVDKKLATKLTGSFSYPLWINLILVDATVQAVIPEWIFMIYSGDGLIEIQAPGKLAGITLAEELVQNFSNSLLRAALPFIAFLCRPKQIGLLIFEQRQVSTLTRKGLLHLFDGFPRA